MGEPKLASTPECVNYCPQCGAKFERPQPEQGEPHLICPDDEGGCGAKYHIRKI